MKSLATQNVTTFFELTERLRNEKTKTFVSKFWMPLTLRLMDNIETAFGSADVYSFYHYFVKDGKILRAPEMRFLLMKENNFGNSPHQIFPYAHHNYALRIYEESIAFNKSGKFLIDGALQEKLARQANEWMRMIRIREYQSSF